MKKDVGKLPEVVGESIRIIVGVSIIPSADSLLSYPQ